MFSQAQYPFLIISMIGGLLTLLGSVGIFISIIIQRKVDRLQSILEEFIDLSYQSDLNLSGQMYNLIEKYQMHYLLPDNTRKIMLAYINSTIGMVLILWLSLYGLIFQPPFQFITLLYLLPLFITCFFMIGFRRLLQYLINIHDTPLLGAIIPAPKMLRSISYLSSFINVSVKSVLKQSRLTLILRKTKNEWNINLKQELSFDDFFYYLVLFQEKTPLFVSFGEILFDFPCDEITAKPCPIKKNINIPLGDFELENEPDELKVEMLIFTRGEKHPITYSYQLKKGGTYYAPSVNPEVSIEHQITYSIENSRINIIKNSSSLPFIDDFNSRFNLNGNRLYISTAKARNIAESGLKNCQKIYFID